MTDQTALRCDGCGQLAEPGHIARRLKRLEWATRFRPVHIQALLLGGVAPERDQEFLYATEGAVEGEALTILRATHIQTHEDPTCNTGPSKLRSSMWGTQTAKEDSDKGKAREAVLAEFQKRGLLLAYVLECPMKADASAEQVRDAIREHLPAAMARIRRSLKPKRVFLLSSALREFAETLRASNLGCPVLPATNGTFLASREPGEPEVQAFRTALARS